MLADELRERVGSTTNFFSFLWFPKRKKKKTREIRSLKKRISGTLVSAKEVKPILKFIQLLADIFDGHLEVGPLG